MDKALNRYRKPANAGDKEAKFLVAVLEKCFAQLDRAARCAPWTSPRRMGQPEALLPDYRLPVLTPTLPKAVSGQSAPGCGAQARGDGKARK